MLAIKIFLLLYILFSSYEADNCLARYFFDDFIDYAVSGCIKIFFQGDIGKG